MTNYPGTNVKAVSERYKVESERATNCHMQRMWFLLDISPVQMKSFWRSNNHRANSPNLRILILQSIKRRAIKPNLKARLGRNRSNEENEFCVVEKEKNRRTRLLWLNGFTATKSLGVADVVEVFLAGTTRQMHYRCVPSNEPVGSPGRGRRSGRRGDLPDQKTRRSHHQ